ncbi:MAG TPA: hypothetical protein VFC68_07190, partial [Treponemataceae bacterium]|nr:hypothetical protein [Treponemataceae bacterium]
FIQYVFNLPMTGFIYGFLLTIVSFLNIFIFATIDIALISLFIIEYIIIYTTRKTRNVWAIIGITILMTLPFIPYLYQIAKYADAHVNNLIVHSSFSVHVLYAWIIVPFEIMMIRIAVRLKIWGRHPSITRKKRIIQVAVVLLIIIVLIMSTFVRKKLILHTTEENIDIKNKTDSVLTLNCSHENLFERQCAQMYIESKTPILRYEIIARSKNPLPILEANYPYDMLTAPCIALFNIDECPPNPLKLTFTYNAKYDVMYEIEAFYTIQDVLYSEKKEYVFPKLKEESP